MTDPTTPHAAARATWRARIRTTLLFVGALLFLAEEWLFLRLTAFFAWLGRLGLLRWLDARLVRLPPAGALVILVVPMLLLFPVKIVGLWMITSGRLLGGCCVMVAAKVLSTAVIARIFLTCRPQLLRMPWFARAYEWTGAMRVRIHDWLAEQPAWTDAQVFVVRLKRRMRGWRRWGGSPHVPAARAGALRRWRMQRKRRSAAPAAAMATPRSSDAERR